MMYEAVAASVILSAPISPTWVGSNSPGPTHVAYAPPHTRPISFIVVGDNGGTRALPFHILYESKIVEPASTSDLLGIPRFFETLSILVRLDKLQHLPSEWAGVDTIVPTKQTIQAAKALISSLPIASPLPNVSPSADGEIGFAWAVGKKRFESILASDGKLVWFWTEGKQVFPGSEVDFDGSFPDELVTALGGDGR